MGILSLLMGMLAGVCGWVWHQITGGVSWAFNHPKYIMWGLAGVLAFYTLRWLFYVSMEVGKGVAIWTEKNKVKVAITMTVIVLIIVMMMSGGGSDESASCFGIFNFSPVKCQ